MKIKYEQTTSTIYDEEGNIEDEITIKTPILIPEEGEVIKNKITNEIIEGRVGVGTEDDINDYEVVMKKDIEHTEE